MKKFGVIFFSVFYLFVTSGFTLNLHYCGSKLKKTSFFKIDEKGCCGSKKKSKGCCKDKIAQYKLKDNQKPTSVSVPLNFGHTLNFGLLEVYILMPQKPIGFKIQNYFTPPVFYDSPIYLKNKVFII